MPRTDVTSFKVKNSLAQRLDSFIHGTASSLSRNQFAEQIIEECLIQMESKGAPNIPHIILEMRARIGKSNAIDLAHYAESNFVESVTRLESRLAEVEAKLKKPTGQKGSDAKK